MAKKLMGNAFSELPTIDKAPLVVLHVDANHSETMHILADKGLKPLTYQEALSHAPELIKELTGGWFWLAGQGTTEGGEYTFNANGELAEPNGKETPDEKVYIVPGNGLLRLSVSSEDYSDWRFILGSRSSSRAVATVVVGIKDVVKSLEDGRAALERLRRGLPE